MIRPTTFLAEHLSNLAKTKGRPADLAEKFVIENLTLSAEDAKEAGVIDFLAKDLDDLLRQLDGTMVEKDSREYLFHTSSAQLLYPGANLSEKMQNLLSESPSSFSSADAGAAGALLWLLQSRHLLFPKWLAGFY